jgi:hypothetical protein
VREDYLMAKTFDQWALLSVSSKTEAFMDEGSQGCFGVSGSHSMGIRIDE